MSARPTSMAGYNCNTEGCSIGDCDNCRAVARLVAERDEAQTQGNANRRSLDWAGVYAASARKEYAKLAARHNGTLAHRESVEGLPEGTIPRVSLTIPDATPETLTALPAYAAKRILQAVTDAIEDRPTTGMRVGTPRVQIVLDLNYAEALTRHLAALPPRGTEG